jgi:serine/threonine protein kinase
MKSVTINDELKAFCELVQEMLEVDPEKRIKPMAALKHRFFSQKFQLSIKTTEEKKDGEEIIAPLPSPKYSFISRPNL